MKFLSIHYARISYLKRILVRDEERSVAVKFMRILVGEIASFSRAVILQSNNQRSENQTYPCRLLIKYSAVVFCTLSQSNM